MSCIPHGLYVFRFRPSKRFIKCYRANDEDTAPRTGILIHPANYVHELKGCIALGSGVDASGEVLGKPGLLNSRMAVEAFEDWAMGEGVVLEISDAVDSHETLEISNGL